ncbi:MAG: hypothetical protein F6K26_19860 [Moorea sp. SIO2I5]|nr:hypothetical protein [Moorena sp. SIO2I5]
MQRGLGGNPHERLHQDKAPLSYGKFKPLALCIKTTTIMVYFLIPHTPHPTPHTPHLRSL